MRLEWDKAGKHFYETGVDQCVLYPIGSDGASYTAGVAWNGITSVSANPSGADPNPIYADNIKYLNLYSVEEFGASIEAYTYPDEWAECDGSKQLAPGVTIGQQKRKAFGLSFRTLVGNDVLGQDYGYKLHLIYNAMASPSERQYQTTNDNPEAATFSWEITTTPVAVGGNYKPTSYIVIESNKANATKLTELEDTLYGGENSEPTLPTPAQVVAKFAEG